MQLTLTFPVISMWVLLLVLFVVGARAQDIQPEFPEDFPRPTTEEVILTTEEGTTEEPPMPASTEEPIPSGSAEEATSPAPTEEATTSGSAEEATTSGSAEEATTPAPTQKPTTTTKEPITTTTTEAPKTSSTTEAAPPTYRPQYAPPTIGNRPMYTTRNPWILNEQAERCYLKDQRDYVYRNGACGPWGWRSTISCYRCCYFSTHNLAGCSKLHRGRCGYYY